MKAILVLIGIFMFPIFTLGCVLLHYDHYIIGTIAILYSVFDEHDTKKSRDGN